MLLDAILLRLGPTLLFAHALWNWPVLTPSFHNELARLERWEERSQSAMTFLQKDLARMKILGQKDFVAKDGPARMRRLFTEHLSRGFSAFP